jgi:hypothetical protein
VKVGQVEKGQRDGSSVASPVTIGEGGGRMLKVAVLIAIVFDPTVVVIRTDDGAAPRAVVREEDKVLRANAPEKTKRTARRRHARVACDSLVRVMVVGPDGKVVSKLVTTRRH